MELITPENIEPLILTFRAKQVMLDSDLAALYKVETKVLNQAVKRNIKRFPESFRFQLTQEESEGLKLKIDHAGMQSSASRSQIVTLKNGRGHNIKYRPYAFTEQGVAMLSAVLRSEVAVQVSIRIMEAFVNMRRFLLNNAVVFQRLETLEIKQLQTESKLDQVFLALEKDITPKQGIFFEGQLFDAHVFASDLIKQAKTSIVLVDNYVDETTLLMLSKRRKGVTCTIHTRIKPALQKDAEKHNQQYPPIQLVQNSSSHDRFLIIDDTRLYHFGASLKDLGNKCFAFSRMDDLLEDVKHKLLA
jgi:hypothetical protein